MGLQYNDPAGGTPSSMGNQLQTFFFQKQALIEARKTAFFGQLADVTNLPKNMGKAIKRYHYLPLLDDANINDQGINAAGVTISNSQYFVTIPRLVEDGFATSGAADAAVAAAVAILAGSAVKSGAGPYTVTYTVTSFPAATLAQANALVAAQPGAVSRQGSGNMYGSSKDIGTISGKLPVLSENGGRVNRVGFKRKELTSNLEKFGFFDEYTQESMDFDSDAELQSHINREMINGAHEITEDILQVDLLNSAGVVRYCGDALQDKDMGANDVVSYGDLMRLDIDLTNNRTPKSTKVITGTRLVDTKTLAAARILYCGSELIPTLKAMKDLHNDPAFIPLQKYAAGGDTVVGEIGSIDGYRIVIVPEMLKWAGAGADASASATHYETNQRFDIFPMLVVGDESFTTIGFQTDGKTVKFKITHKAPGDATADKTDPFGETGFMSIKWYYGFMVLRPERIALIKTTATM
jgi:N4-gp56 family major capsid protein